jgi:arylsulfatase A-like enzyme
MSQVLDQPMAALLADLKDGGLLDETLVVWMGEFGRDYSGGNHYAKAWTTAFAGAGVKGGRAIGRTDAKGMTVEDRPVKVADFAATIYQALGIDLKKKTRVRGRPIGVVDGEVKPLNELFS